MGFIGLLGDLGGRNSTTGWLTDHHQITIAEKTARRREQFQVGWNSLQAIGNCLQAHQVSTQRNGEGHHSAQHHINECTLSLAIVGGRETYT
jgi:hypothetical protein